MVELLRYGGDVEIQDGQHFLPLALTSSYDIRCVCVVLLERFAGAKVLRVFVGVYEITEAYSHHYIIIICLCSEVGRR